MAQEQSAFEAFKEALSLLVKGKKAGKSSVSAAKQKQLAAKLAVYDWMAKYEERQAAKNAAQAGNVAQQTNDSALLGQAYSADADSVLAAVKRMK